MSAASRLFGGRFGPARRTAARVWTPIDAARTELGRAGTATSSALALPGLSLRLALRYLVGRLVGVRVEHAGLTYDFGGTLYTTPSVIGRQRALILLGPSVLLVLVGIAFGLPLLLEIRLLGVDLVPSSVSADGAQELVVERFVVRGLNSAVGLWCALSAWYAAALSRDELMEVLDWSPEREERGTWGKALAACLAPFRALTRVTDPLDRFLGIATGATSVLLWFIVTGVAARLLF